MKELDRSMMKLTRFRLFPSHVLGQQVLTTVSAEGFGIVAQ